MDRKILFGILGFFLTLLVLAGAYKLVDNDAIAQRNLRYEDYITCFENDKYVKAIEGNFPDDTEKLAKLKSSYYIECINGIRSSK